ncbi:MAG: hypothetical protein COA52_02460 [Hyphomicrobiales bacterium]|nr:MAG: hypothetical protein COA52_02460 [Hyphomicrobiales bacterium]
MSGKWKVGQKAFIVWPKTYSGKPRLEHFEITKIGRKWAYFDNSGREDRFDVLSGEIDGKGYCSPGHAYVSELGYHDEVRMNQAWLKLGKAVRAYHPPEHLIYVQLDEFYTILTGKPLGISAQEGKT